MTLKEAIERHVQHLWDAGSPDARRGYTHSERFFVRWLKGEGSRFGLTGDSVQLFGERPRGRWWFVDPVQDETRDLAPLREERD